MMAPPPGDDADSQLTGRQLGEFLVGELIGRGGFAHVYRARQSSLGRDAVIKVMRPGLAHTARDLQMFEREARLASQLDHPFAAHVYAFGAEPDGLLWIAMELVRGTTLAEWLDTHGPLAIGRFVPLFERVCEVVHTAHAAGLIHRDIKPHNIMVITRAGRLMPKLLDFGIATLYDGEAALDATPPELPSAEPSGSLETTTEPNQTVQDLRGSGTPAYMAPEQWQHGRHDHRVDIYALGVVAYRCLTGRAPFEGRSPRELFAAHARAPVPPLGEGWSGAFDAVIATALAKDPHARYASALELATALATAASESERSSWLDREVARPWQASAPPHLAACVSAVVAAHGVAEARDAVQELVAALAQWIGVLALAARTTLGAHPDELPQLERLRRELLTPREWLELGRVLCAPYRDRDELFPIPELVRWFADAVDAAPEGLLALLALARGDGPAFPRDVLGHVLRGLGFLHGYTLLIGDVEWTAATHGRVRHPDAVWVSDGDRNRLFRLAPIVAALPPAPGEALELFALAGAGRTGAKLVARPEGFEHETASVWPWLAEHFAAAPAARHVTLSDRPPYRGLATFSANDAELFFGRDRQVEALYNRMLSQPFVALTGPSGSGKSSVVLAGLIPRLPADWTAIVVRPGRSPLAALEAGLAAWPREERRRLLLVVDQAEELLTIVDREDESAEFAATLSRLLGEPGDRVRILVTIRDDFIGRADELPAWRELIGHNLVLLTIPSRDDLARMVAGPAAQVGYGFDDPRLIADMVEEVADRPGALPLLSFAASRLWEARDATAQLLTRSSYIDMGGVGGALARYAEETLRALTSRQQAVARLLFRHLVTADGTRAPARRDELATITDGADIVLAHLIAARILVAGEGAGSDDDVALAHEALIDRWPRLIQWRAEDAAGAHHRDELRAAAALWHQHRRDASYLWRGRALATYEEWAGAWAGSLTSTEAAFGVASVRAAASAKRRRRAIIGGAVALLSATVVVLLLLNRIATRSRAQAEERLTDVLADRGRAELLAGQPLRALLYLGAAYERGRDGAGMRVGLAQAARAIDRETGRITAHRHAARLTDAGSTMVSSAGDEPARTWQLVGGRLSAVATLAHDGVYGDYNVAMSGTGDFIATAGYEDNHVRIWDRRGTLLGTGEPGLNVYRALAFAPGGELVASSWADVVALWDHQGHQVGTLGTPNIATGVGPFAMAFDDDGHLVTVRDDGTIEVWQLDQRRRIATTTLGERPTALRVQNGRIYAATASGAIVVLASPACTPIYRIQAHAREPLLALAFDGSWFATAASQNEAKIWRASDGRQLATLPHALPVTGLVISPDSRVIATAGSHSVVTLWDAQHATMLGRIDAGADISTVGFSTDGKTIFTATADGRLETWDAAPDAIAAAFWGHGESVWSAAFSPDGATVATIGLDSHIRLWQAATGQQTRDIDVHSPLGGIEVRERIAFSPDGHRIAGPFGRDAAVWDIASGLRVGYFDADDASVVALAFDRAGRLAVVDGVREDGHDGIAIWDPATEQIVAHHVVASRVHDVAFDPTGTRLAACTDDTVLVWDVARDRVAWTAHGEQILDVDYSADGRFVSASGADGYVRIWRADSDAEYRVLKQASSRVWAVAFSPDASLLAVAGGDNRIYVWDVESGTIAAVVSGHEGFVTSLAFDPSGTRLASTGVDGRAFVWTVARETRSPLQLAAAIGALAPVRLDGVELVSADR